MGTLITQRIFCGWPKRHHARPHVQRVTNTIDGRACQAICHKSVETSALPHHRPFKAFVNRTNFDSLRRAELADFVTIENAADARREKREQAAVDALKKALQNELAIKIDNQGDNRISLWNRLPEYCVVTPHRR